MCYADQISSDLQTAFGNNGESLRNHYFSYGIGEGRNASCDTTQPENSQTGIHKP